MLIERPTATNISAADTTKAQADSRQPAREMPGTVAPKSADATRGRRRAFRRLCYRGVGGEIGGGLFGWSRIPTAFRCAVTMTLPENMYPGESVYLWTVTRPLPRNLTYPLRPWSIVLIHKSGVKMLGHYLQHLFAKRHT
jgi:hypothetical protein